MIGYDVYEKSIEHYLLVLAQKLDVLCRAEVNYYKLLCRKFQESKSKGHGNQFSRISEIK